MILQTLATRAHRLPMRVPWDAAGSDLVLVVTTIETDRGDIGTGFTWSPSKAASALTALLDDDIQPLVAGRSLAAPTVMWDPMWSAMRETGSGGITTLAIAAVDIALWDLWAKQRGASLVDTIGRRRNRVDMYASGVNRHLTLDALRDQVERWVAGGATRFKIKVGLDDLDADVERVALVRDVVGPDATVMIDANQLWDLPRARRAISVLARFDPFWIEEPLPADDIGAYADLRRRTSIPLAAGESLYSRAQFRDLLLAGAVDYVQPNVCRVGGITPTLRIADLAHVFGVPAMLHLVPEISAQLAMCLPLPGYVEDIDSAWFSDLGALTDTGPILRGDSIASWDAASASPGHGLRVADRLTVATSHSRRGASDDETP